MVMKGNVNVILPSRLRSSGSATFIRSTISVLASTAPESSVRDIDKEHALERRLRPAGAAGVVALDDEEPVGVDGRHVADVRAALVQAGYMNDRPV